MAQLKTWNGSEWVVVAGPGSGDVSGPASSTDNALSRFDGTTGKLLQNSGVTVDDSDVISAAALILSGNIRLNASFPSLIDTNGNTYLVLVPTVSAVNTLSITNKATGSDPEIGATGSDTNVGLNVTTKGSGVLKVNGTEVLTRANKYITYSKIFTLEDPGTTDAFPIMATLDAITFREIRSWLTGGTDYKFNMNIRGKATPATAGTDVFTANQTATASTSTTHTANNQVGADKILYFTGETGGTGTPTELILQLFWTIDA